MLQVGYWTPVCREWLLGVTLQGKYLGYDTPNVNTSRGQHLPNASFSSINIFGPNVTRDFTSQTRVKSEVITLLYAGAQLNKGYVYLGVGPALFRAANSLYVSSVHKPNGVGDNLISTSVTNSQTVWGGAAQVGYNYYLNPTCFLGFSYTYSDTGKKKFSNSVNTAILNGFDNPGPTTLNLGRTVSLGVQEVMFSINKVF